MTTSNKTALVIGATGVVGTKLVEELRSRGDWNIIGLSRRGGTDTANTRYVSVDLLDVEDTRAKLQHLQEVTHIFFSAFIERPTWAEMLAPNLALLVNVIDVIEPVATNLQHISLMQGYKVYGAHLGQFTTPVRESDGTHASPEYNVVQQRFVEQRQRGKTWTWSAMRPSAVGGSSIGTPMNLALVIAVYASISKELGVPLRFPGKPGTYATLMEMTDATMLAKATIWAATNPRSGADEYNIANGDLFRWTRMWKAIAAYFDMEVGDPIHFSLDESMPGHRDLWEDMMRRYGLKYSYDEVSTWWFGDHVLGYDYDFFADTSKIRRAGFHEYVETEDMFRQIFDDFRTQKIIP
jgi:nucleoside-diphosphate-sugar epimerase